MANAKSKLKQRRKVEENQTSKKQDPVAGDDVSRSERNGDVKGNMFLKLLVILLTAAVIILSVYAAYTPEAILKQGMDAAEFTQRHFLASQESNNATPPLEQASRAEHEVRLEGGDTPRTAPGEQDKRETNDNYTSPAFRGPPRQRISIEANSATMAPSTGRPQGERGESKVDISETQIERSEIDRNVKNDQEKDASEVRIQVKDEPAILFKDEEHHRGIELEVTMPSLNTGHSHPPGKNQRTQTASQDEILEDTADKDSVKSSKSSAFIPTLQKRIAPKKVFIDGRRIPPVELLAQKPNNSSVKVYLFNDLLSAEECDSLRKAHEKHVSKSSATDPIICFDTIHTLRKHLSNVNKNKVKVSPSDFTPGTTCLNATFSSKLKIWLNANWSYSTAFYPGESKFSLIMAQRLKDAMGLMPENGGKFQITSYPLNVGYKGHTDCVVDSTDKRDRVATVLVYLETVNEGGETEFPELGIWVKPRKGRALLWNNMDENGRCEPLSIHQAAKVKDGHKYILQRWYYYESFSALGKRPPEPSLPARTPGQPRVTCDEYEHGSCRWYDEWNYEHIVEYNRKKHSLT